MSDDELSEQQLQGLAEALRKLKVDLGEMIALSAAGAKPVDLDQPIGRLSRMDAMQQQKMAEKNRSAAKLRLQQVGAALVAITSETGSYGECHECDEPIAFRRLQAKPESRFCVGCQSVRERR